MAKLEAFRTYCSQDRPLLYVLHQIKTDPLLNIPEQLIIMGQGDIDKDICMIKPFKTFM